MKITKKKKKKKGIRTKEENLESQSFYINNRNICTLMQLHRRIFHVNSLVDSGAIRCVDHNKVIHLSTINEQLWKMARKLSTISVESNRW